MNMRTEPAVTVGVVSAFVAAALALLVAFGLPITDDVQSTILGVIAAAWPLVTAILIRPKVYSPATVSEIRNDESPTVS